MGDVNFALYAISKDFLVVMCLRVKVRISFVWLHSINNKLDITQKERL